MGDSSKVNMGVCNIEFNGVDVGYTKGYVKVKYSSETVEKIVDQMDTPIDEIITKQVLEVEVPMAEKNLSLFADLLPGATLTTGTGDDAGEYKLELSGSAGGSLGYLGAVLVIKPVGGTEHDWLTLYKGVPIPNFEMTYDKDNPHVYTFTFKAMPDADNDWVMFGKEAIISI